jgi:hypothetical protein
MKINLLMLVGAFLTASGMAWGDSPPEETKALSYLLEGYLHNRDSFGAFTCEFEYARGWAKNADGALTGQWNGAPLVGRWLVNGSKYLYQLHAKDEAAAQKTYEELANKAYAQGAQSFSSPGWCELTSILSDGAYTLVYNGMLGGGELTPPEREPRRLDVTPWTFGVPVRTMDPVRELNECIKGTKHGSLSKADGGAEEVWTVQMTEPENTPNRRGWRVSWSFARSRGFLPRSMETFYREGEKFMELHVLETREFSGGRWFPVHFLTINYPRGNPMCDVCELRVTGLHVDKAPDDASLSFTVPRVSELYDHATAAGPGFTIVAQGTRIGLGDLKRLYTQCVQNAKENNRTRRVQNALTRRTRFNWALLIASGVGSVLVVGCIIRVRRRWSA